MLLYGANLHRLAEIGVFQVHHNLCMYSNLMCYEITHAVLQNFGKLCANKTPQFLYKTNQHYVEVRFRQSLRRKST